MRKIKVDATIKVHVYPIVADAITTAIELGWKRAYKHTDNPSPEIIKQEIETAILNSLCEILQFS